MTNDPCEIREPTTIISGESVLVSRSNTLGSCAEEQDEGSGVIERHGAGRLQRANDTKLDRQTQQSTLKWHKELYIYIIYISIHFYPFLDNLDDRNVRWRSIFDIEINNPSFSHHPSSIIYQYRGSMRFPLKRCRKSISRMFPRLVSRCFQVFTFSILGVAQSLLSSSWMNSDLNVTSLEGFGDSP